MVLAVNGYAQARGKDMPAAPVARAAVRPLSEAEQARVAGRVRQVKEHIPEAMDFIRELHEAGMVDGLRCIQLVTVFEEGAGNGAE